MEKQKCPEVRFKGFSGDWEDRKLSEIATMHARIGWQNLRTSEFLDRGDYMLITGTDFDDGKINYSTCHYVEKERYEQDRYIQIRNGSILITKDGTIGKVAYVQGLLMPATLNAGVFNVEIKDSSAVNELYLFQYLKAPYLMDYVGKRVTGGTIKHLNQNILVDFPVVMPTQAEQTQIGNFFQNLDQSLALHEKKLAKTQNLKKAMLEKMFPKAGSKQPEIRLKGFSGNWALQPLENIFGKIRNAFVGTATPYYVKSGRFYLESNNVKDGKINRKSEIFINDYFYYKQQDKWLKTNDIVMVQSGHVGHTAVITEELNNSAAHALIMFTDYKVDADPHFINYQIQTDNAKNEIDKITTGNTIKHILSSDMKKFSLLFPCVKEQEKIGHFFKQLDEALVLQQQQLQTLKNLKQAFLEKMFV